VKGDKDWDEDEEDDCEGDLEDGDKVLYLGRKGN